MADLNYIAIGKEKLLKQGVSFTEVPGLGFAGKGVTFKRNSEALSEYSIKTSLIGQNFIPDTEITLLGQKLKMPIMVAPMSGIKTNLKGIISEKVFLGSVLEGTASAGTIGWCGDSFDTTNNYIVPNLIKTRTGVAVLKPRNFEELALRIKKLADSKVLGIGIDLDGIGALLLSGVGGVSKKDTSELNRIRKLFKGPMFLKGLLSVNEVGEAYNLGYDGVVISNHGGRVLDYASSAADVLPKIAAKFKGKLTILADGGISNGFDVFTYLALGADAVLVGRCALYACIGAKSQGVETVLNQFKNQLKKAMLFSGCKELSDISLDKLNEKKF